MLQLDEETREFLIESNENLATLDREIVELEQRPDDIGLISSVFRTIHTIKGTCGFFGFDVLGALTHVTENLLGQVRERQRPLTPELISLVLESVDEVKSILARIEETGAEGEDCTVPLRARLEASYESCGKTALIEENPILFPVKAEVVVEEQEPAAVVGETEASKDPQLAESTIRVDVGLLNRLMNLVGELVLARNQLLQDASAERSSLQQTSQRLNLITSELQEGVMKTRMQSVGSVWNKLPRVVRDLAARCGKRVRIEMEGANTELDKTVLEAIKDPLTHVVRNACDHGIETPELRVACGKPAEGLLRMRAYHEGGVVNIEVSDDGCGIDPEKVKKKAVEKGLLRVEQAAQLGTQEALNLIFLPGFSTAAKVTSISGRGVGMDVVKTNIEKIGGSVTVMNRAEGGTTIRIKIPLTLAIIPGLLVTMQRDAAQMRGPGRERFIIPQVNLLELVRLERTEELMRIQQVQSTSVFRHRGKLLPLIYLGKLLGCHNAVPQSDVVNIVVLQAENRQMGLVVDAINETQEIVVKPLGRQLKPLSFYLGATIMGDGQPALILDVAGLARQAGIPLQVRQSTQVSGTETIHQVTTEMLLLFRAGAHRHLAVRLEQVNRIEKISIASMERAAGKQVLNYRGNILPLVSMPAIAGATQPGAAADETHVIVFRSGDQSFGLIVDEIIDILNEPVTLQRVSTVAGLSGSTLLAGKVTDLVHLPALAALAGIAWPEKEAAKHDAISGIALEVAA